MITIDQVFHIVTATIAFASALAPVIPHPDKVEGIIKAISKVINFLALNYDKLVQIVDKNKK